MKKEPIKEPIFTLAVMSYLDQILRKTEHKTEPDFETDKYKVYYDKTTTYISLLKKYPRQDGYYVKETYKMDGYYNFTCNEDIEKYLLFQ